MVHFLIENNLGGVSAGVVGSGYVVVVTRRAISWSPQEYGVTFRALKGKTAAYQCNKRRKKRNG